MSWAINELAFDELAVDKMVVDELTPHPFVKQNNTLAGQMFSIVYV
jgi:hypothetical protein